MIVDIESNRIVSGSIESLIGGRQENQDYAGSIVTSRGVAVVVCDGMGGLNGGAIASHIAVNSILSSLSSLKDNDDVKDVITEAINRANNEIIETAKQNSALEGMGTTLAMLFVSRNSAIVAHVGDSRIYQLRGRGKVYRTFDHSLVFQMVNSGVLTEEQARTSANSNVITKALGIGNIVEPEIAELPYLSGDKFLICSDGFWGAFPEREFISKITARGELKNVLANVANVVNNHGFVNGGGHDNLTAALVKTYHNSKIKVKMSKSIKVLILILSILLLGSICGNYFLYNKLNTTDSKDKGVTDNAQVEQKG